jgi:hypothetical protein
VISNGLQALATVEQYRASREHVFSSPTSVEWFIRMNRSTLAERGALFLIAGRRMINPAAFDAVVLSVGQASAQAQREP